MGGVPSASGTVHERVRAWAVRAPDAAAVSWAGESVSYGALVERADRVRDELGAVGGRAVAVRLAPGPRQAAAVLGALSAGAHVVCFGPGDQGERGRTVLAELRPRVLIRDGDREAADELAGWYRAELGGRLLDMAESSDETGSAPVAAGPAKGAVSGLEARAYVAYTSGSSGVPKGIPQSHAALAQFVEWLGGHLGLGPGARVAQWAAPGYDASLCELFAALTTGATVCPVPERIRAHPEKLAGWLEAEGVTVFQTVPSFARALLKVLADGRARNLGRLTDILLAGEPLPGELAGGLRAALPAARLTNLYGPTETILATWHPVTGPVDGTVPIGRAIPGRRVLVLDQDDRPCPPGAEGQIVLHSPYVTPGYVGAAAGHRDPFRPPVPAPPGDPGWDGGRWYRTGDLGRLRPDGTLEFAGRADEQIKFLGIRLELTDIEMALEALDSVRQCAVVPQTDPDGLVTGLVAYIVPVHEPARPATWRAQLRRRFGAAMPPVSFETVPRLPRNAGGKVDRHRLRTLNMSSVG
ncbi:amino acid adenylation domain-containing protein [Actinomadura livida]|uniref:Amino acid adenylation domain-containing protein n=1 Tax=Actinomadura livida TaxID=79909 RepID=A0A7W7I8Z8_9ACTN|nr:MULTISPECIES: amino acid adenylation domain-containing protein [Actinomadura]MBB4772383.1 amino acid adenylation domain-containing protein [Actinomadura catellatispora]GGU23336.1 hypothetical protein GCM10010208_55500 [Actinomadura livida]